jgi:hypothetical protein
MVITQRASWGARIVSDHTRTFQSSERAGNRPVGNKPPAQ